MPGHIAPSGEPHTGPPPTPRADQETLWARRPGQPRIALPPLLALIHTGRHRAALALLGAGLVVGVAMLCSVPLYASLAADAQIQRVLATSPSYDTNVELSSTIAGPNTSTVFEANSDAGGVGDIYLSGIAPTYALSIESAHTLDVTALDRAAASGSGASAALVGATVQALAYDFTQAQPHMRLLAGRLPATTPRVAPLEVLATPAMGVQPGDTLHLQYLDLTVPARVVGVWQPRNPLDPFWNGRSFAATTYTSAAHGQPSPPSEYPLLMTQDAFISHLGITYKPNGDPTGTSPGAVVHVVFFTLPSHITVDNLPASISAIEGVRTYVGHAGFGSSGLVGYALTTRLDSLLLAVQQQLGLLAQPLYIVAAQIMGLALLFVAAMAGLVVQGDADAIALLKSRGASDLQVLGLYMPRGLVLVALATVVGPLLALPLSLGLTWLFVSAGASSPSIGDIARAVAPETLLATACVGAVLGGLVLAGAIWRAARSDVLAMRRAQGREPRAAFWRRHHLDLWLAAVCAAGYLELGQFGPLTVRGQLDATGTHLPDLLLVLAPSLLVLAGSLVALRLFPLVARGAVWPAVRARGATAMLALAQVARATRHFTRMTLLLTLAVAVGFFALTYQASLRQNATDRAAAIVGGDVRVSLESTQPGGVFPTPLRAQIAALPNVLALAPAYRDVGWTDAEHGTANLTLLGVEPTSLSHILAPDPPMSAVSLLALLRRVPPSAPDGVRGGVPGDAQHPLWAIVDGVCAATLNVAVGERFALTPQESLAATINFVVAGILPSLPTMSDALAGGDILTDLSGYVGALTAATSGETVVRGQTEYWLRTNGKPVQQAIRALALSNPDTVSSASVTILDRQAIAAQLRSAPLTAGMGGLLLTGAGIAALLALLGGIMEALISARLRARQFAVLRTLGMSQRQLVRVLLLQQAIVYVFGLLVGTLLGALLSSATLPFLAFSAVLAAPSAASVAAPALVFDPLGTAGFYAVIGAGALLALAVSAHQAACAGLGQALRVGED